MSPGKEVVAASVWPSSAIKRPFAKEALNTSEGSTVGHETASPPLPSVVGVEGFTSHPQV